MIKVRFVQKWCSNKVEQRDEGETERDKERQEGRVRESERERGRERERERESEDYKPCCPKGRRTSQMLALC